jgi:hypothetical protein
MLSDIKDTLASTAVKSLLASRMQRYGKLTDLRICSHEKTINSEFELLGEESPVSIKIERYRIIRKPGGYKLIVEQVSTPRPWLQNLMQDFLVDKPLSVPSSILFALGKPEE